MHSYSIIYSYVRFSFQPFLPRLQLHITGLRRCRCAGRQALSLSSSGRGTLVSGGDGHDAKDLLQRRWTGGRCF